MAQEAVRRPPAVPQARRRPVGTATRRPRPAQPGNGALDGALVCTRGRRAPALSRRNPRRHDPLSPRPRWPRRHRTRRGHVRAAVRPPRAAPRATPCPRKSQGVQDRQPDFRGPDGGWPNPRREHEGWSTKDGTDTRRFQTWQRGHRGPYRVNSQFAYMGDTGYHRRAVWLREEARLAGGDWREARAASHATRAAINAWWSSPPPARHGDVRRPETGPNPRVEYCGPCEPHERCPPGPPSGPRGHRYRPPVAPPPTALRTVREHRMACAGAPPIRRGRSRLSAVRVSESGAQRRGSFTQVLWSSSSLASHR